MTPTNDGDMTVRLLRISVNASPAAVYDFASNPMNLPKWAAGLCTSIEKVGNEWIGNGQLGRVKIDFAEPNHLGILDHQVTLPSGQRVKVPIRVLPKGSRSEVLFTLQPMPGMTEAQLVQDAKMVMQDLAALKKAVEG